MLLIPGLHCMWSVQVDTKHGGFFVDVCNVPVALIKNTIVCVGVNPSCAIFSQTQSSVPSAEPSGRWRNRCSAHSHSSKPPVCAPASGPDETQTAAGSTAAKTPPGLPLGTGAVCEGSSAVLRNTRHWDFNHQVPRNPVWLTLGANLVWFSPDLVGVFLPLCFSRLWAGGCILQDVPPLS